MEPPLIEDQMSVLYDDPIISFGTFVYVTYLHEACFATHKKKASFQGDDRTSASHVRIINSTLFHFLVPPLKVHLPSSCHQSLQ